MTLKNIFGPVAQDIEYYAREGFGFALRLSEPDSLNVAIETALGRYGLMRTEMFVSPPYPDLDLPGYMVLQDQAAAHGIWQELIETGFDCPLVQTASPAPRLAMQ